MMTVFADKKITELPLDNSPSLTDLILTVDDVSGTPVNKRVTLQKLKDLFDSGGGGGNPPPSGSKRYWGASPNASLTNSEILAFSSDTSSNRTMTKTVIAAPGATVTEDAEYIYFIYPSSFGAGTFTINGFVDNTMLLVTQDVTPVGGTATSYRVYRTANALIGSYAYTIS